MRLPREINVSRIKPRGSAVRFFNKEKPGHHLLGQQVLLGLADVREGLIVFPVRWDFAVHTPADSGSLAMSKVCFMT